ncbi:MAG: helix-turn-helix domain-containing protein [Chloroflexi bacterium]|nr:helix-turn-helix domain-containing protein [Chloroflexota bacterium]
MNQPDLGHRVIELRQQKGFTQEQLAEKCEVSPRTIQRIESGEVDPRTYTLQCLSKSLEFDFLVDNASNENLWLAALHLSNLLGFVVIPLLLWSWKKNQSYKVDKEGRQVLNFQITITLALFAAFFLLLLAPMVMIMMDQASVDKISIAILTFIIPMPLVLISLFCAWQGVVNTIRSLFDKPVRYRLAIPFIKK